LTRLLTALTITLVLAGLAPAGASASYANPVGPHVCPPAIVGAYADERPRWALWAWHTSCSVARALERWRFNHGPSGGWEAVYLAGRWWYWHNSRPLSSKQEAGGVFITGRHGGPSVSVWWWAE
jgi:hypothetical protein